jgi:preprotein translocase subunit SecF
MRWFKDAHYDFMSKRRLVVLISIVPILVGLVSIIWHKGLNTSIDFAGGTLVEVGFRDAVPIHEVRAVMERSGFPGAEVTNFGGSDKEILIQVKRAGDAAGTARKIESVLKEQFAAHQVDLRRVETVGPKVGSELKMAALWAVIYSLAGIVAYVSWRFQFKMGIAAIIALAHDTLFTLGFFSITNREISLAVIAAILAIIGYSLNDTIVVFDRIRENLQTRRRENFISVVNTSINETLSRTIVTGLTTIFSIVVLIIVAGPVIRDFAITLLIGMVVGTYSTVYIASAIIIEWDMWRNKRRQRAQ